MSVIVFHHVIILEKKAESKKLKPRNIVTHGMLSVTILSMVCDQLVKVTTALAQRHDTTLHGKELTVRSNKRKAPLRKGDLQAKTDIADEKREA